MPTISNERTHLLYAANTGMHKDMKKLAVGIAAFVLLGSGCSINAPQTETPPSKTGTSPSAPIAGTRMDLSGQGLTKLPASVFASSGLEELDVSDNSMTGALPSEIGSLRGLKRLYASNNRFTGIPAEIGKLENLEVIDFSYNGITGMPYELGNLENLRLLDLRGNDVSQTDLKIIRDALPPTTEIKL